MDSKELTIPEIRRVLKYGGSWTVYVYAQNTLERLMESPDIQWLVEAAMEDEDSMPDDPGHELLTFVRNSFGVCTLGVDIELFSDRTGDEFFDHIYKVRFSYDPEHDEEGED